MIYRNYMSLELFQIMTPNAALNMDYNSVTLIKINGDGSTDISIMEGKAFVLYGPDEDSLSQEKMLNHKTNSALKPHLRIHMCSKQQEKHLHKNKNIQCGLEIGIPIYKQPREWESLFRK